MNKQVLVTGGNGQLGMSIQKLMMDYPEFSFKFVTREDMDLSKPDEIEGFFKGKTFDFILNCAAYTLVDKAETEQGLADIINHKAVEQLASIAKKNNIYMLQVSTDYVFDGSACKPYKETDVTGPNGTYGATKLAGETAFLKENPQGLIVRTSWLYSEFGNNFVKTMLRLGEERESLSVIFDQIGTPTYAPDLARAMLNIISNKNNSTKAKELENNVYHYSNEGVCSWYDFAQTIFEISNIQCCVSAIESKDYPTPAKRPYYSVLNKNKIKSTFMLEVPYWRDSLKECLEVLNSRK